MLITLLYAHGTCPSLGLTTGELRQRGSDGAAWPADALAVNNEPATSRASSVLYVNHNVIIIISIAMGRFRESERWDLSFC